MSMRRRLVVRVASKPRPMLAALGVSWLLGLPAVAGAQTAPTIPVEEEIADVTTSTTPEEEPPAPGTVLAPEEYEPPPPPTAAEVEATSTPEAQRAQLATEQERFLGTARSFAEDIRDVIKVRYDDQRARIAQQFDVEIRRLEDQERGRRLEAIERFEEFLRKYPNDPDYTPDAMFRLAELYFERSSDKYLVATRAYEEALVAYDAGELATEPTPPVPNYDDTVNLYRDLLARFPDYRHADAARYLLGYSFGEMGLEEESLAMFTQLVERHPTSRFLPEVYTRIGEIYFDMNTRTSIEQAIAAYSNVLRFRDSTYFDKALYKLAWAHYRLDQFDEAVTRFVELVEFADAQKKATGKSGSELRAEALQYIAISLADEKWGGVAQAERVLGLLAGKTYVGEMWKRYGEILFDQTRYALAIDVLTVARDRYPNTPYNPEIQAKIITAYERLRDFDGATAAREVLVQKYAEGQPWHEANAADKEALAKARELTERSLYTAAIFHHQQAQAYKQAGRNGEARASYRRASVGYRDYLGRFPDSKNAYDFNFYLAECLYYSDEYADAANQYELVRDSNSNNKHLESAALSAVIAYEKQIEALEADGKLEKLELRTAEQRKDVPVEARPIAESRLKLVSATDRFATLLPDSERVPAVAYRAGEVYYKHDHLPEARTRFEKIVTQYPGTEVARYAANLIIESYLATKDWDNVEKWSQRLIEISEKIASSGGADSDAQKKMVDDLRKFKVGAIFKRAEELDAKGDYEAAAETYVKLVDETPDHEFADKALYNAAIAYEKVKRFDSASKIYQRIYDNYPKSDLADKALFRVGVNYEKDFDFAGAISAYTKLVERYPNSPNRADALFNVAVMLENMQQYGQAAAAFKRYATIFPKREDAGQIFFRAALVYEKMSAWSEMISTLDEFIKKYAKTRAQSERIVHAWLKIGEANLKRSKDKSAVAAYSTCIKEFGRRGFSMSDRAASYAAQCQFELAEDRFRSYDKVQLVGTGKTQIASLKKKAEMQRDVEGGYVQVFKYKRVETTLAALYRVGHSYERFADALYAAEVPPEFRDKPELADEYKLQLEQKAQVLERKAEAAYRKAYDEARKTKVTNQWSQRTLEGLNKYQPEEFPVQKAGLPALQTFTITGHGLDVLDVEPRQVRGEIGAASAAAGGAP
jgi:TolA-binding protein